MIKRNNYSYRKKNSLWHWLKNNLAFIISFLIPIIIMIIVYYLRKIYPFGDNMYLRSDMYHQYAPFHQELQRKLTEHGSLFYSWNIGMGTNFISLMSYYLASPLNFLMALLPTEHIPEIMSSFIIFKIGLCGLTCSYYLGKHFRTRNITIVGFGCFYALSSYLAAYSWNLMWLDCLVLLPMIALGIERLVKQHKGMMYCVCLSLAVLSNYYIAIMLCFFSCFYFLIQLIAHFRAFQWKNILITCGLFGFFSFLAGCFGAVYLFPEYYTLMLSASGELEFPTMLSQYFSVLHMLARGLMTVEPAVLNSPHDPNLYCTVLVFLLIPLYLLCKKINTREKIGKFLLLMLLLLSFNLNIPNFIWHGLHFPNSLPCRESFIFIFLAITMSYEALYHIHTFSRKQLFSVFAGVMAFLMIIEEFMLTDEYEFTIIYVSGAFILLYTLLLEVLRHKKYHHIILFGIFMLLCVCEAAINTEETAIGTTSRSSYLSDNKSITRLLDNIPDTNDFYRTEKLERRTKNDAAWSNYHGVSLFSSNTNAGINEFLSYMGHETSYNSYSYYGNTPFSASLLGVKYLLSNESVPTTDTMEFADSTGDYFLYKNLYTLPLAFRIPSTVEENAFVEGNNPFAVQNSLLEEMTGLMDLFTPMEVEDGKTVTVYTDETSDAYVFITTSLESVNVNIYSKDGNLVSTNSFTDLDHKQTIHIGTIPKNGYFEVTPTGEGSDSILSLQLYAYAFHSNVFRKGVAILNEQAMHISQYTDTSVKGNISVKEEGTLYTSIPYETGWRVYVDGEEMDTYAFENAFVAFDITAGDHIIEMHFTPAGFKSGLFITVLSACIIVFVGFIFPVFLKKKLILRNEEETIENDTENEPDNPEKYIDNSEEKTMNYHLEEYEDFHEVFHEDNPVEIITDSQMEQAERDPNH